MKSISSITTMLILLLAACGPAGMPGSVADFQPTPVATPKATATPQSSTVADQKNSTVTAAPNSSPETGQPSPNDGPVTATTLASPTARIQLLPNWQTVAWQGLIIPVPPNSVWETPVLNREQINGVSVAMSGALTYPTSTAPVERPYGPDFTILAFIGSLNEWLDLERRNETSKAGNTVQEQTIREIMIAGRQAKAYQRAVIGTGQIEYYVLKLNNDKLLFITSDDAENDTYRRVIDGLVITEAAAQSATAGASPSPPSKPAPPNATGTAPVPLPSGWQTVAWQGLTIPIPPKHGWEISQPNPDRTFIAPVLEYGRIAFDRAQALPDASELPDGMDFTILQWRGSLDDWLVAEQKAAPAQNPIDTNTVRKTAVAGQPAIAYSYMVTGVSNSQTLALKLNADRILLINNSNVDNPEYQAVLRWLTIGNQ